MRPQDVVQKLKAGRGFLLTRNSATIADTDYEKVADEIAHKMNAYPLLVEALRKVMENTEGQVVHRASLDRVSNLLRELGETK